MMHGARLSRALSLGVDPTRLRSPGPAARRAGIPSWPPQPALPSSIQDDPNLVGWRGVVLAGGQMNVELGVEDGSESSR